MNNKQLSQIKDLISNNKRDRFIIFDNQEPALVVMSVDEYKKIVKTNRMSGSNNDEELIENINRTIGEWKAGQVQEDVDEFGINEESLKSSDDNFFEDNEGLSYYYDLEDE